MVIIEQKNNEGCCSRIVTETQYRLLQTIEGAQENGRVVVMLPQDAPLGWLFLSETGRQDVHRQLFDSIE
jgi:hypothetical protein